MITTLPFAPTYRSSSLVVLLRVFGPLWFNLSFVFIYTSRTLADEQPEAGVVGAHGSCQSCPRRHRADGGLPAILIR